MFMDQSNPRLGRLKGIKQESCVCPLTFRRKPPLILELNGLNDCYLDIKDLKIIFRLSLEYARVLQERDLIQMISSSLLSLPWLCFEPLESSTSPFIPQFFDYLQSKKRQIKGDMPQNGENEQYPPFLDINRRNWKSANMQPRRTGKKFENLEYFVDIKLTHPISDREYYSCTLGSFLFLNKDPHACQSGIVPYCDQIAISNGNFSFLTQNEIVVPDTSCLIHLDLNIPHVGRSKQYSCLLYIDHRDQVDDCRTVKIVADEELSITFLFDILELNGRSEASRAVLRKLYPNETIATSASYGLRRLYLSQAHVEFYVPESDALDGTLDKYPASITNNQMFIDQPQNMVSSHDHYTINNTQNNYYFGNRENKKHANPQMQRPTYSKGADGNANSCEMPSNLGSNIRKSNGAKTNGYSDPMKPGGSVWLEGDTRSGVSFPNNNLASFQNSKFQQPFKGNSNSKSDNIKCQYNIISQDKSDPVSNTKIIGSNMQDLPKPKANDLGQPQTLKVEPKDKQMFNPLLHGEAVDESGSIVQQSNDVDEDKDDAVSSDENESANAWGPDQALGNPEILLNDPVLFMKYANSKSKNSIIHALLASIKAEQIPKLLETLKQTIQEVCKNKYGNYVVQLVARNLPSKYQDQFLNLVDSSLTQLKPSFLQISCDPKGTFAIQGVINTLKDKQSQQTFIELMKKDINKMLKNKEGSYIVKEIFKTFDSSLTEQVTEAFMQDFEANISDKFAICIFKEIAIISSSDQAKMKQLVLKFGGCISEFKTNTFYHFGLQYFLEVGQSLTLDLQRLQIVIAGIGRFASRVCKKPEEHIAEPIHSRNDYFESRLSSNTQLSH